MFKFLLRRSSLTEKRWASLIKLWLHRALQKSAVHGGVHDRCISMVGWSERRMDLKRPLRLRVWLWIVLATLAFLALMQIEAPGKLKAEVGTVGGLFIDLGRGCIERPAVAPLALVFAVLWFLPFGAVSALLGWVGQYLLGWIIDTLHSRPR
jgi:hypothetical protein